MDEALTTLVGWVARRPLFTLTRSGVPFLSLRAGVTPRRLDRGSGRWEDGPPTFVSVVCWRSLAENVQSSDLLPGTPVIVQGRLRVREYEHRGERRWAVELEALAVGHDLNRGIARFTRVSRAGHAPLPRPEPDGEAETGAAMRRRRREDGEVIEEQETEGQVEADEKEDEAGFEGEEESEAA